MIAPLATIIVVTHNSARWLARMVAALEAQTETRWRLVVFDNGSNPDQRPHQTALPPGSSIHQSAVNLGFAEANNLAADETETPYLVFLNPDAFPEPRWLDALLTTAELFPEAGAIGSTQWRADAPGVLDGVGDVLHASGMAYRAGYGRRGSVPPLGESFAACGAAMLVRRDAFEAAGGFDDRYFCYFEDVDLCFRLRLLGWRVLQSPDAVVQHVGGGVIGARSAFGDYHGARNRLWTFVKCMPAALFWPLLPVHLIASALVLTVGALRGRGLAGWRGFLDGLNGLTPFWKARAQVQATRKASSADIASVLTWSPDVLFSRRAVVRPPKHTPDARGRR